jgi:hypothetical protein
LLAKDQAPFVPKDGIWLSVIAQHEIEIPVIVEVIYGQA